MLRNTFQGDLIEDPFFAAHRNHMMSMGSMFQMADPFGAPQIIDARIAERERRSQERRVQRQRQLQVAPFGMGMMPLGFGGMLANMDRMMSDMHSRFEQPMRSPTGNGANFVQSSFVSYSNVGNGSPRVYQSSVTQRAQGGAIETQRSERDSATGVEKVEIGHKIGDREHTVEKSRNRLTGENNVNQEFINIDEEEAQKFDQEFQNRVRQPTMPVRSTAEHRRHRVNPTNTHGHSHIQSITAGHNHSSSPNRSNIANQRPASSSQRPSSGSHQQVSGSHRPVTGSRRPVSATQKPVSASHRPVLGSHRPVSANNRPVSASHRLGSDSERQDPASHKPVSASHKPVSASQRPVSTSHRAADISHRSASPIERAAKASQKLVSAYKDHTDGIIVSGAATQNNSDSAASTRLRSTGHTSNGVSHSPGASSRYHSTVSHKPSTTQEKYNSVGHTQSSALHTHGATTETHGATTETHCNTSQTHSNTSQIQSDANHTSADANLTQGDASQTHSTTEASSQRQPPRSRPPLLILPPSRYRSRREYK